MCVQLLKLDRINIHWSYIEFQFDKVLKKSKQGQTLPRTRFDTFEDDPSLCPTNCLTTYIKRTKRWRNEGKVTQLFLSRISPHAPVLKPTIASWVKELLADAGIDTSTYQAHSTRSAGTSKAKELGVPLEDIVKQGNWTNKTTFERFYFRPIEDSTSIFQRTILEQVGVEKPL